MASSSVSNFKADLNPCRICLGEEISDLSNPIITPCKCSGSMGCIHLNCLRKWIRLKITITSTSSVTSIAWKTLTCELCKTPYPYAVYFDGNIHELISIPRPRTPYAVFESAAKAGDDSSSVYIVSFSEEQKLRIVSNDFNFRDATKKWIGDLMT